MGDRGLLPGWKLPCARRGTLADLHMERARGDALKRSTELQVRHMDGPIDFVPWIGIHT